MKDNQKLDKENKRITEKIIERTEKYLQSVEVIQTKS